MRGQLKEQRKVSFQVMLICHLITCSDRLHASATLRHPWLIQSALCTELHVTKTKLKRYVIKKRWAKAVSAVIALKRMGAKFEDVHVESGSKNGEK